MYGASPPVRDHSLSLARVQAADLYWDANGADAGTGGTGTWTTANTWRAGSAVGTLGNWADANDAYFGGTAGVVTIGATAVAPGTSYFTVTGYTLQTDGVTTTRSHNGGMSLSDGVTLNLNESASTANRTLNIGGSVSGGTGSALSIQGNQAASAAARVNLNASGATISVPTTITGTGTGFAGYVATASNTEVSGNITNNST